MVVLDDGRVDESGSHADLVAEGGAYADLWARQAGDEGSGGVPADD